MSYHSVTSKSSTFQVHGGPSILSMNKYIYKATLQSWITSAFLQVQFRESGTCHGFVLWIDWLINEDAILSTGPGMIAGSSKTCYGTFGNNCVNALNIPDKRYWKQAVKLLSKPADIRCDGNISSAELEASFDPSKGDLVMKHAFTRIGDTM